MARYQKEFAGAEYQFRDERDIHRNILGLDAAYCQEAILEEVHIPQSLEKHLFFLKKVDYNSYCGSEDEKTRQEIRHFHPQLFCINASPTATAVDKKASRDFMKELFPKPSPFEKEQSRKC